MQRCIRYKFCSRDYWLMYNGAAMFAIGDIYGGFEKLFASITPNTADGLKGLFEVFLILAENGNAARSYMGYEVTKLPDSDELAALSTADDISRMRNAVISAITAGLGREVKAEDDAEVDLGLEELNAKKKQMKHVE